MTEYSDKQARTWATLCHISALLGFLIPFGSIAAPLIIWLLKRGDHPFIDQHGKEAVNFQISLLIYLIISVVLSLVLIGMFLAIGLGIFALVVVIIAAVKANNGETYRYPLTIRFIK